MRNKIILSICSFLLVPLLLTVEAQAAIYKCVNTKAEVYYNDKPCPLNDKESQLKAVKDPKGGYIPPEIVVDPKVKSSKGVEVGSSSEKVINSNGKKISESTSNNNSSSSNSSSNNNDTSNNSLGSNSETVSSNSSNENNGSSSKEPIKNVILHEGYYKDPE